jgi:hypothetical protein
MHVPGDDCEGELADAARRERVDRDTAGRSVDRAAASAAVIVGAPSGSTPTTRIEPAPAPVIRAVAMPDSNPPPPTAAMIVVASRACRCSSSPVVPAPSMVSGWSKAGTGSAPLAATQSWLTASASE